MTSFLYVKAILGPVPRVRLYFYHNTRYME